MGLSYSFEGAVDFDILTTKELDLEEIEDMSDLLHSYGGESWWHSNWGFFHTLEDQLGDDPLVSGYPTIIIPKWVLEEFLECLENKDVVSHYETEQVPEGFIEKDIEFVKRVLETFNFDKYKLMFKFNY